MKDFAYAILLNIAAAIIFWIVFALLPERRRRNKLRPRLELGIYQVYSTLFTQFDGVMRHEAHSPSTFQKKIKAKTLNADDIELGLQNKCLNDSFLYDPNVSRLLMPIGKQMLEERSRIDRNIDRAFAFSGYLTTAEILLLERIRAKLEVYDLDRQAKVTLGTSQLWPVDPSLSFMSRPLCDLYQLFLELQMFVLSNKSEDRDIVLDKVQCFYEQGQYKRCKRFVRRRQAKYPSDKVWFDFYVLLCEHKSGRRKAARRKLEEILKAKPDLVSSRGFLVDIIEDRGIREVLERQYTEPQLAEFDRVLRGEFDQRKEFLDQANKLKEYYRQKIKAIGTP